MFQVSEFARLAGLSAKVLRDYDEAGLFRPAWVDRHSGYRRYSPAQLPELRRIVALRELGLPLAEIRALVRDGSDLREALERRRAQLEAARRETDRRLAELGISLALADGDDRLDVVVRTVGEELVATLDVAQTGGDDGRAFYELERTVRDAGVRAPRPPGELVNEAVMPDGPPIEVFVPVRRSAPGLAVRRLPAIRAATILHQGSYETMAATRRALDDWVAAARYQPRQPLRVIYLQFGAEPDLRLPRSYVVDSSRQLLTELHLPLG